MPAALNKKACTLEKHMEDYPIVSNTPSAEVLGDKNVSETGTTDPGVDYFNQSEYPAYPATRVS